MQNNIDHKNYLVGHVKIETKKAFKIGADWWPKSQISIVNRKNKIIIFMAPEWLFNNKEADAISFEMANKLYKTLVIFEGENEIREEECKKMGIKKREVMPTDPKKIRYGIKKAINQHYINNSK